MDTSHKTRKITHINFISEKMPKNNDQIPYLLNTFDSEKNEVKKRIELIQGYIEHSEKLNSEIKVVVNTKPYRLAYLLRRFTYQFLKGSWDDRKKFIKWINSKLFNKKINDMSESETNPFLFIIKSNNKKIENLNEKENELKTLYSGMEKLEKILFNNNYDFIDLFVLKCGWKMDLFQRPQHISINLSDLGGLVLFRGAFDGVDKNMSTPLHKIKNNLYLIDMDNKEFFNYLIKQLENVSKPKILHLYSTDNNIQIEEIKKFEKMGFKVLYEYVDEISPDISQREIPEETYKKHEFILKNKKYQIITTADKLYQEVYGIRKSKNMISSCNGVDYSHWKIDKSQNIIPNDLKEIVESKKPLIGYYGAIAPWLDYELVEKILKKRPKYQIIFIGQILNSSFDENAFNEYTNFHFLGAKDYYKLNTYANHFDVCMIPFVVNGITESTSPIKLFEYMALNKPIVTTDLVECRKYDSVIIGKNHDDFIEKIDFALQMKKDQNYINLLDNEALENTWKSKTKDILKFFI